MRDGVTLESVLSVDAIDITLAVLAAVVVASTIAQYRYTQRANRELQSRLPRPEKIVAGRIELQRFCKMSTEQAQQRCAELLFEPCDRWIAWESGDEVMHPALWDLFELRKRALLKGEEGADSEAIHL